MSLGENIRERRKALGMTQEVLGERLGMAPQTVSKWERDESMPDAALLPGLADALHMSLDRLFERKAGSWEDAEAALRSWLLSLPEKERPPEMRKLWEFLWLLLYGSYEPEGHDPFADPGYPREENFASMLLAEGIAFLSQRRDLPFFCLLEGTAESWGEALADPDGQKELWEALADSETRRAILRCYGLTGCIGSRSDAAAALGLTQPEKILPFLEKLRLISVSPLTVDREKLELLHVVPEPKLITLLLLARAFFGPWRSFSGMNAIDFSRMGKPLLAAKE